MNIRHTDPARDFDRIAELLSLTGTELVTADGLREDEARAMTGKHWRRWVADDRTGHIVGYAMVIRYPSQPEGMLNLELVVDPAHRRQGIGSALYGAAIAYARAHEMRRLLIDIRDDDPPSLEFARTRGFVVSHHSFASVLELATFDEAAFSDIVPRVEASGIRFFTLADTGQSGPALRQLYGLNRMAALDEPGSTGGFPIYENWLRIVVGGSWYRPESQFIAAEGDMYVGLAGVYNEPGVPETMFNGYTGVHRAYRGQGIGLALKLLTIRYAKTHGAQRVTTSNDERNAAMLAINRKLGYVPSSGYFAAELREG